MQIQAINYQTNFEAKKFRLPSREPIYFQDRLCTKWVFMAKEYSNPNAKDLYMKAQATNDWKEKTKLYNEMGHYKQLVYGTGIVGFFRMLFDKPKPFI